MLERKYLTYPKNIQRKYPKHIAATSEGINFVHQGKGLHFGRIQ